MRWPASSAVPLVTTTGSANRSVLGGSTSGAISTVMSLNEVSPLSGAGAGGLDGVDVAEAQRVLSVAGRNREGQLRASR